MLFALKTFCLLVLLYSNGLLSLLRTVERLTSLKQRILKKGPTSTWMKVTLFISLSEFKSRTYECYKIIGQGVSRFGHGSGDGGRMYLP